MQVNTFILKNSRRIKVYFQGIKCTLEHNKVNYTRLKKYDIGVDLLREGYKWLCQKVKYERGRRELSGSSDCFNNLNKQSVTRKKKRKRETASLYHTVPSYSLNSWHILGLGMTADFANKYQRFLQLPEGDALSYEAIHATPATYCSTQHEGAAQCSSQVILCSFNYALQVVVLIFCYHTLRQPSCWCGYNLFSSR